MTLTLIIINKDMIKYYIIENSNWVETKLTAEKLSWHWLHLYDDNLKVKGIGMYKKIKTIKP